MLGSGSKRILVLGINYAPELTGIGKYTGEMVDWLADNGYECSVVTAFPYYPQWKVQKPYGGKFYKKEIENDGKVTVYRCPLFVPSVPTGFKRIVHDASFFLSASLLLFCLLFKRGFDDIFCIAPPFHLGFLAIIYRAFKGGRVIYHIQDLQVDAAKKLGIVKSAWMMTLLFGLEKMILRRADLVSTIADGMARKIRLKADRRVEIFPNWVDTRSFYPLEDTRAARIDFGIPVDDKVVLYSGSIGEKQGLESIIDVADELRSDEALKFVICGAGPYKQRLEEMTRERGLKNVLFYPIQDLDKFNEFLNVADVHLVLQKSDASDLLLPSKLTTILAVGGLALVTADPDTSLYDEIAGNNAGILIRPDDPDALLEGIKDAVYNDHGDKRQNARRYAENNLSADRLLRSFKNVLES